jgi:hypothetical protein
LFDGDHLEAADSQVALIRADPAIQLISRVYYQNAVAAPGRMVKLHNV